MRDVIRRGTRLGVVKGREIRVLTHWKAPFTDGFTCAPAIGTVLVVDSDEVDGAQGFYCIPEDYDGFETAYVPLADRSKRKYDGYSLVAMASDIGNSLELVP